jgi:hypothetical protein
VNEKPMPMFLYGLFYIMNAKLKCLDVVVILFGDFIREKTCPITVRYCIADIVECRSGQIHRANVSSLVGLQACIYNKIISPSFSEPGSGNNPALKETLIVAQITCDR